MSKLLIISLSFVLLTGPAGATNYCSEAFWTDVTIDEVLASKSDYLHQEAINDLICDEDGNICDQGEGSCNDEDKNSVFHIASRFTQNPRIIALLIRRNADVHNTNGMNQTVLEYSSVNRNTEIYDLIERLGQTETAIQSKLITRSFDTRDLKAKGKGDIPATKLKLPSSDRGWYIGLDAGVVLGSDKLKADFFSDDSPTNCDGFLNQNPLPLSSDECQVHDYWSDSFDRGKGGLVGAQVGYAWKNWRVEGELTHKIQSGGLGEPGYEDLGVGATKAAEFVESTQAIRDVRSNSLWANAYYDFDEISFLGVTGRPFLGAGVGWEDTSIDYHGLWHRNPDSDVLVGLGKIPEAAGTLSLVRSKKLRNQSAAYQAIAGIDFPLRDNVTLGVQVRYADAFKEFHQSADEYDILRSHESRVVPGGSTVGYAVTLPKKDSLSFRVQLKVFLGKRK